MVSGMEGTVSASNLDNLEMDALVGFETRDAFLIYGCRYATCDSV